MVNIKIVITFCWVFLQARYSKITCRIVLSQLRNVGTLYCEIRSDDVREAKAARDMNVSLCYRSHVQVTTLKQDIIQTWHFCIQRPLD